MRAEDTISLKSPGATCVSITAGRAEDFRDWLADKLARRGRKGERASERRETDAALAEPLL